MRKSIIASRLDGSMTVAELQDILRRLDPDSRIVMSDGSGYVSNIKAVRGKDVTAMWGPDFEAFVIIPGEQQGRI